MHERVGFTASSRVPTSQLKLQLEGEKEDHVAAFLRLPEQKVYQYHLRMRFYPVSSAPPRVDAVLSRNMKRV
ncbi:cyclin-dependent protein kinase inhibitor [Moniliophthora roreri]|nr:cyclin-dependent protein kinase inhibitor [Moniliophthora roreri]